MRTKQIPIRQPKFTIAQFNKSFPDDDACLETLKCIIYPDGIVCRLCKVERPHHKLTNRKAYSCDYCGTHVYPLAGTIFAKTTTPLKSWFYAMHLMASTRCGISAKQLERELGVTYKTAWRIFNQLRKLMAEDVILSGSVEADETYVGGSDKNKAYRKRTNTRGRGTRKTTVVGVVQRGGKVAALVAPNASRATIEPFVRSKVLPDTMIYTDEWSGYDKLEQSGYGHKRIRHAERVYVMGNVHTNTIEGFWSLLKNGIRGVYHSVSTRHLQDYINEYAFRYNHRRDPQPMYSIVEAQARRVRCGNFGKYAPLG
jgi:transposase